MKFDMEIRDDVCVLSLEGRLDSNTVQNLKTQFDKYIETNSKFVFNLDKLEFIDSTGLGGLVSCLKKTIPKGGDLKIVNLSPKPKMVFEITRAHKVFDIYDDLDTAVESFSL
ncbi:Stage II sporulation protein AA [Sedimentisphaera cyanobacteriorum]|uniref:Anti-sigma factor antagonist n=1 Tax=Sedimentisphaera cyanobacteriorum TaxID=1940790 RepID=A0A1Q2HN84_9BACT|nr:STAS domain-containing protein [Sedimentisphaera cyanobacteriorum]AQQ08947.1 Stage II sporulation protein AA [Sedimentisphaera cyanobacteriorum]